MIHPMFRLCVFLLFGMVSTLSSAQLNQPINSSDIRLSLERLGVLGTVLYVAAHPDDENTRLIAYMSKERKYRTAYLSITRGDGGQNLIGPEIREKLGIIRSHELMAARRVDGGEQFFTRANDFGYSKSVEETLEWWGKEEVIADMVDIVRYFQPDVIITRFPPDERAGHGHHTASAVLAHEVFRLAADPSFTTDLQQAPWQAKRIYMNTGRWWSPTVDETSRDILKLDVGGYNPLLGESYPEVAARARTQHKSQGFGSTGARGEQVEYLEYVAGEKAVNDVMEGVETSWNRVPGGAAVEATLQTIIANFEPEKPENSVKSLLELRKILFQLPEGHWKQQKIKDLEGIILDCLGLYREARAQAPVFTKGETVDITTEWVVRNPGVRVELKEASGAYTPLSHNKVFTSQSNHTLASNQEWTQPYWLQQTGTPGRYALASRAQLFTSVDVPALTQQVTLRLEGVHELEVEVPVVYKWNDPVDGESWRPLEVLPPVTINVEAKNLIFPDVHTKQVEVVVRAHRSGVSGELVPKVPKGWRIAPEKVSIQLKTKGAEQRVVFTITPPKGASEGELEMEALVEGNSIGLGYERMVYAHLPSLMYMPPSHIHLVKIDLKTVPLRVGYLVGAGDEIPSTLRSVGMQVEEINGEILTAEKLKKFDAIVLGIRALNVRENIRNEMTELLRWVEQGGTLVVQYNTVFDARDFQFSPYPLRISRERVSEEDAKVHILQPSHRALTFPNKITAADFEGWVQERGLYFPNQWDATYTALLSSADTGEPQREGGLLVAPYGKGHYVYSGYSWFRQLPAGVPGAYRLFVNMLSMGKSK
jgi:LmbE family N-acetylglucosaminyl deacetylase